MYAQENVSSHGKLLQAVGGAVYHCEGALASRENDQETRQGELSHEGFERLEHATQNIQIALPKIAIDKCRATAIRDEIEIWFVEPVPSVSTSIEATCCTIRSSLLFRRLA